VDSPALRQAVCVDEVGAGVDRGEKEVGGRRTSMGRANGGWTVRMYGDVIFNKIGKSESSPQTGKRWDRACRVPTVKENRR
jgi:hypothetical protein